MFTGDGPLPAKIIRLNGINVSAEVVPVMRQRSLHRRVRHLQRFNDVETRQNELRNQLLHKGYRAKYTFDDVVGSLRPAEVHKARCCNGWLSAPPSC